MSSGVDTSLLPGVEGVDDLVNADLDGINSLISTLSQIADESQQAAQTMRGSTSGVTWTGQAADAFHASVGKLPSQLDTVSDSYTNAATAMTAFYHEVATAQPALNSVLTQLQTQHSNLSQAQSMLADAQTTQAGARTAAANAPSNATAAVKNADNTSLTDANTAVSHYSGVTSGIQSEIDSLVAQGRQICSDFVSQRTAAASQVKNAASGAPHESFWDSVLGDIDDVVDAYIAFEKELGKGLLDVGKIVADGVWKSIQSIGEIPDDIGAIIAHPLSASAWLHLGEGVVALGTVALMATGLGEAALGGELAVAGAEGAAEGAAEDAAGDAVDDAADDAASDATQSLKARAASRLNQINRAANDDEAGVGKIWKQTQDVVNDGQSVQQDKQEYDDIKDGNWKGAAEEAGLNAAGGALDDGEESLVDKVTGTTAAEDAAKTAETFEAATAKAGGDANAALAAAEKAKTAPADQSFTQKLQSNVSTAISSRENAVAHSFDYKPQSTLSAEQADSIRSAAGVTAKTSPAAAQKAVAGLDPSQMVTNASHSLNNHKLVTTGISQVTDHVNDQLEDKAGKAVQSVTGVKPA